MKTDDEIDIEKFFGDNYCECTSQELANFAGVSLRRIQQWENEGTIESVRSEGNKRIYDKWRTLRNIFYFYKELARE